MKKREYKKMGGFSLIELIITIAILAIFVGGVALSTALLRSADTRGLASEINNSLTDLKSNTEAHKGPFYLHIYKNDTGFYAHYDENPDSFTPSDSDKRLGHASLKVLVRMGNETDPPELDDSHPQTIMMRKKDGAYKDVVKTDGTTISVPKVFEIYNGSQLEYKVYLAKDTGLHYMDRV